MFTTLKRGAFAFAAGAAVVMLTGCASFEFTKAPPVQAQPVSLQLSTEGLSSWSDLPIGVYRVPDSQVVITGHQKAAGASMMFGLIGVAIAHSANAAAGGQTVKDVEQQLRITLDDQVKAALGASLAADGTQRFTLEPGSGPALVLTPAVVLSFTNDTDLRPYVVLKAALQGADKKPLWSTRYIASTGPAKPLLGEGSWTANDGALLKDALKANVHQAVRTMLRDLRDPYKRDDNELTMVQGHFPFIKPRMQTVGYKLGEDEHHIAFIPKLGDVLVFTGVNLLDKGSTTQRPATKDDAVLKLLEEAPATAPAAKTAAAPGPAIAPGAGKSE
ncbi:MAG: hypothetical protein HY855_18800 [Burkholderiales bacterium]|nr:hypothetical protein [Burkholderiales bacterium]